VLEFKLDPIIRLAAAALLVVGCVLVLQPFAVSALLAVVIASSVWPAHSLARRLLRGSDTAAAAVVSLGLVAVVLVPVAWMSVVAVNELPTVVAEVSAWVPGALKAAPDWLHGVPFAGDWLAANWTHYAASREELATIASQLIAPAQSAIVQSGMMIGSGLVTVAFAVLITFFLLRDGEALVVALRDALRRLAGEVGDELIGIVHGTVQSVIYGMIGTAAAQSVAATIGFVIVGLPGAPALGAATFLLSVVPVGPPLVWGPGAVWLLRQGQPGWALFLAVYGMVVISGIDNVVKPMIISRGVQLPFVLVLLGVLGGVLAFGFVGIFLGPTILAVSLALGRHWVQQGAAIAAPARPG
jgi:predicted PurR-regulated permease PerM